MEIKRLTRLILELIIKAARDEHWSVGITMLEILSKFVKKLFS